MKTWAETREERNAQRREECYGAARSLWSMDGAERTQKAFHLAEVGEPWVIGHLLEVLDFDRDEPWPALAALQANTLRALRVLGDSLVVEFLCASLQNPALLQLRAGGPLPRLIEKTMKEGGQPKWAKPVCENLKEHGIHRVWAVMVLGEMRAEAAVGPLVRVASAGGYWTRLEAIRALGEIGSSDALPCLMRLLSDEAEEMDFRMEAAYSLGKIGDRDAVLALCEALDVEWTGMWYAATWALRLLGDSSAVFALCNLLRSTSGEDRVHVAEALADIGGPTAIEALCGVLGDSNTETAAAAAEGLGRIGGPTVVKALCDFLEGRDAQSSINEIDLNGLCHKHVATDTCPHEAEELVKCACVKALGDIGSVRAFPVLKRVLLDDSNPTTLRSEAAGAMGDLGLPGVVPPLLKVLEDKDSSLVSSVAWRLGMLKAQGAILPICRAAITRMDMDLEEIAYALSGFPRERVAEAVERVLNTADPVLVSDLVDALRWCGVDPPTPTPIKRLLLSTDVRAKAWARRALEDWGY